MKDYMVAVISAAFVPFGSLCGPNASAIAESMVNFLLANEQEKPTMAEAIVSLLIASGEENDWAGVAFTPYRVTLVTPTSRTEIDVSRRGDVEFSLNVDFGANGSEYRAAKILAAIERSGFCHCITAYSETEEVSESAGRKVCRQVTRREILAALIQRATEEEAEFKKLGPYYEARRQSAADDMAFFQSQLSHS